MSSRRVRTVTPRHGVRLVEEVPAVRPVRHASGDGGRVLALRRSTVLTVAAVAVLGTAGAAAAYWTTTGGPATGSGTTGTASISASAGTASGLYPGATVPVAVTVTNGGPRPVALSTVAVGAVEAAPSAACAAAVTATPLAAGLPTIPAGATTSVNLTVSMNTAAANTCQGAVFTIPVTATGTQR